MTIEQLAALSTELRTQDNAITADPLFVVFQEEKIYGVSQAKPILLEGLKEPNR